jgi:hypothetical protein
MNNLLHSKGIDFYILIGPNKSSIYPEYLPDIIVPIETRYINPLFNKIKDNNIKIFDPTQLLINNKNIGLLYYKTDTHWNNRGAYIAFNEFNQWAGFPKLPNYYFQEFIGNYGDLVAIGGFNDSAFSKEIGFNIVPDILQEVNEVDNIYYNQQSITSLTAWIFGDSFANALKPYILKTFRQAQFFGHHEFESTVQNKQEFPDIVLWIIVERNFVDD